MITLDFTKVKTLRPRKEKSAKKKKSDLQDFCIIIDTREQLPFSFNGFTCQVSRATLQTGDYSVKGYEKNIVVERKSKADLFQSVGRDRQRLQKEFERLTFVKYSAIVIEADWREIERKPENTIMNPVAVRNTLFSWCLKYNVIPILANDRREAERLTFEFLAWAWKSLKKGEKKTWK